MYMLPGIQSLSSKDTPRNRESFAALVHSGETFSRFPRDPAFMWGHVISMEPRAFLFLEINVDKRDGIPHQYGGYDLQP
jgi:hypothetical protein